MNVFKDFKDVWNSKKVVIPCQLLKCVILFFRYVPFNSTTGNENESVAGYENYALFSVSSMQYVILAMAFSKGAPYRLPLYKNWSLQATVAVISLFTFYLMLGPSQWFQNSFELMMPPKMDFRVICVALCGINFVLAGIHEFFICDYLIFYKLRLR